MSKVLVGVKDWCQQSWAESFYPEDLPEDWHLGYYANEYDTTVIDLGNLDGNAREALLEGLEDCHEAFRPVLQVRPQQLSVEDVQHFLGSIEGLDDELGLGRLAGVWLDDEIVEQLDMLQQWREAITDKLPIAASMSQALYTENREFLQANKIAQPVSLMTPDDDTHASWLVLTSLDLPSRVMAEKVASVLGGPAIHEYTCLIAIEGYSDYERMHEFSTVVQLLGG